LDRHLLTTALEAAIERHVLTTELEAAIEANLFYEWIWRR
jgi:hypothetical protein